MEDQKDISKQGYKDDSPYKDRPYLDIHTPDGIIDMTDVSIPLLANNVILGPNSGLHKFNVDMVREIPLAQAGGESWYNDWWKTFEKSSIGKLIDAKGLKKEKNFWMEQFGYEPDKEEKDAILDAAAIFNPIPDFVHALSKAKEDKYTDAALYAAFGLIPFTAAPLVRGAKEILKKGKKAVLKSFTNLTDPNILPKPSATPLPKQIGFNQKGQVIPQQHMVNVNRGSAGIDEAINDIRSGEPMWFAPTGDTRYLNRSSVRKLNPDFSINKKGNAVMDDFVPGLGQPVTFADHGILGNTGKKGINEYPMTELEKKYLLNNGYHSKYVKDKAGNVIDYVPDYDNPILRQERIYMPGHQGKIEGVFAPDIKFKIFDDTELSRQGHAMHIAWEPEMFQSIIDEGYDAVQLTRQGKQLENILLNPDKFKFTHINEMPVTYDIPPFKYGGSVKQSPYDKEKFALKNQDGIIADMMHNGAFLPKFEMGSEKKIETPQGNYTIKKDFDKGRNLPYVNYKHKDIDDRVYYDKDDADGSGNFQIIDIAQQIHDQQRAHELTKKLIEKYRNGDKLSPSGLKHLSALGMIPNEEVTDPNVEALTTPPLSIPEITFEDLDVNTNVKNVTLGDDKVIPIDDQIALYMAHVSGAAEGTPYQKKLKRIYDKLNRVYYQDSKKAGLDTVEYMKSLTKS